MTAAAQRIDDDRLAVIRGLDAQGVTLADTFSVRQYQTALRDLLSDRDALHAQLNTPELLDFSKAVVIEAAHQRDRWGADHDADKGLADWFWLVGYLAGKALHACNDGDREKALHHVITAAAALNNWHAAILKTEFVSDRAIDLLRTLVRQSAQIQEDVRRITQTENEFMGKFTADIDAFETELANNTSAVDSVTSLISKLLSEVAEANDATKDDADKQRMAAIIEKWRANDKRLADATVANTPASTDQAGSTAGVAGAPADQSTDQSTDQSQPQSSDTQPQG